MSRYARSGIARKKIFSLATLVYLIIFFLPVYLLRASIGNLPTNFLEISIAVLFVAWVFKKEYRNNLKHIILSNKKYFLLVFLIFLGLLISTKVGGKYQVSLGITKGWFVFPFVFLLLAASILPPEKRKNAFLALFFSAFAVSVAASLYYLLGRITFDGRLQAFFNSPNYLAMYLAPGAIIGCLWVEEKLSKKNFFMAGLIVLMLALIFLGIYLTFSYAAWVSLGLSLVIVLFLRSRNYKKIILIVFLIALFFSFQVGSKKLEDLIKMNERSSFSSRLMIWNASKMIIQDNWMWGIGPGNFQSKYLEYQKYVPPYLQWAVSHPHDLYFDFWLYSGIIGLVSFLALAVFSIRDLFRRERDFVGLVALGIILYILFHGIADTTYFKNDLAVVFWMIFLAIL